MKVTIAGNAVVITSSLKLEDINTIKKYRPQALTLMGGDDGKGGINANGAIFAEKSRDGNEYAVITMPLDAPAGDIESAKAHLADTLGDAAAHLTALEAKLPAVLEEIRGQRKSFMDGITVMA